MTDTRQHVHELIDKLPHTQLIAVAGLFEAMIHADQDDDELTADGRRAIAVSREYFQKGGAGIPFEQVDADLGFTMDQVCGHKGD